MAAAKKERSLFSRFITLIMCASLCRSNVNEIVVTRMYPPTQMGEQNTTLDTIHQDEANNNNVIDADEEKVYHKDKKRKRRFWQFCRSGGKRKMDEAGDEDVREIDNMADESELPNDVARGPTTIALIDLEEYGHD